MQLRDRSGGGLQAESLNSGQFTHQHQEFLRQALTLEIKART